jgi:hypothetical protein
MEGKTIMGFLMLVHLKGIFQIRNHGIAFLLPSEPYGNSMGQEIIF